MILKSRYHCQIRSNWFHKFFQWKMNKKRRWKRVSAYAFQNKEWKCRGKKGKRKLVITCKFGSVCFYKDKSTIWGLYFGQQKKGKFATKSLKKNCWMLFYTFTVKMFVGHSWVYARKNSVKKAKNNCFICFTWFLLGIAILANISVTDDRRTPGWPYRLLYGLPLWAVPMGCHHVWPPTCLLSQSFKV